MPGGSLAFGPPRIRLYWAHSPACSLHCNAGAVEKLSKDAIRGWRGTDDGIDGSASQCRDWLLVCLYAASLLLTFVNENVGLRMYYAEYRSAGWYHQGEAPAEFDDALSTWHVVDMLRLLLPLLAWGLMMTDKQCQLYHNQYTGGKDEVTAIDGGPSEPVPWDRQGQLPAGVQLKQL